MERAWVLRGRERAGEGGRGAGWVLREALGTDRREERRGQIEQQTRGIGQPGGGGPWDRFRVVAEAWRSGHKGREERVGLVPKTFSC
jgi:hypothetical protein